MAPAGTEVALYLLIRRGAVSVVVTQVAHTGTRAVRTCPAARERWACRGATVDTVMVGVARAAYIIARRGRRPEPNVPVPEARQIMLFTTTLWCS